MVGDYCLWMFDLFYVVACIAEKLENARGAYQVTCAKDKHGGHLAHSSLDLGEPPLIAEFEEGRLFGNLCEPE